MLFFKFVFNFLSGCQGYKWVLFLEWNVSSHIKSFIIRETIDTLLEVLQSEKPDMSDINHCIFISPMQILSFKMAVFAISLTSYQTTERVSLAELSLRARGRGLSLATMSVSPGYFHRKQKENRTQRSS